MKQVSILLIIACISGLTLQAQSKKSHKVDFTDPKSIVNSIFYAAQTKDLEIMQCLIDPLGEADGDVKGICSIQKTVKSMEEKGEIDKAKEIVEEFVRYFKEGRINGQIKYEEKNGIKIAKVPFWFNHPSGEERSNEEMNLVNRYGNWYLSSF